VPAEPRRAHASRLDWLRRPRAVLALALLVHVGATLVVIRSSGPGRNTDFDRFWEIASTPGRPYIDYQVERAPGEVAVLEALAPVVHGRLSFGVAIVLLNLAADAAIIAALAWGWGVGAAAYYAWCVAPLLELFFGRMDLWSIAAATLAVAMWRRNRRVVAALGITAGAAFKLWPLVLAPLVLSRPAHERRLQPATVLAAAATAGAVAWFLVAGWSGFYQVLTFRGAQGWQIEGMVGGVLDLIGWPVRLEGGAFRIGSLTPSLSIALFLVPAPLCLWAAWRGGRAGSVGAAWTVAVGTLLLFSALFSAQFVGWLIPAGAIAFAEHDRRSAALIAAAVLLTTAFYRFLYGALVDGAWFAALLVVARNAVLAAAVVSAIGRIRGDSPPIATAMPRCAEAR